MMTQKRLLKQKFMENKREYQKPKLTISVFSVHDIIRVSTVPCPAGDTCKEENGGMSLDDQILSGQFK